MFEHIEELDIATGMTECPTCPMQMAHGTGDEIKHLIELCPVALVE